MNERGSVSPILLKPARPLVFHPTRGTENCRRENIREIEREREQTNARGWLYCVVLLVVGIRIQFDSRIQVDR